MWPPGEPAPLGMGCMRLSTERDRDDTGAVALLHAALDAGVTLLDTADAYCRDESETGHNERLIARALDTWGGDRSRVLIATKGGLTRPQGQWIADGRARHVSAACEASRRALAGERIDLYQLHAPDPRTPLATSVRALDALRRDGLVRCIGLCNVNVGQIEEARAAAAIDSVQTELSLWHDDNILNGVAAYCLRNRIPLIAHRPLGGTKRRRRTLADRTLNEIAARHEATPFEIALAWLTDLSSLIVPIPGPTRIESVRSIVRASQLRLSDDDWALLDEHFPAGRRLRHLEPSPIRRPSAKRTDGEIVLIMGLPAAGKSTLARRFVQEGYARVNRDEAGGSLRGLIPTVDRLLASGHTRLVLDNTYLTRKSRAPVVDAAAAHDLPIRCVWLTTGLDDAQVNAAGRMLTAHGRLLEPDEIRTLSRRDPAVFAPGVQFRHQRELEPPDDSEEFTSVESVSFQRAIDPAFTNRALIVWCDEILLRSRSGQRAPASADDAEVPEGRGEILRRYEAEGWRIAGLSWRPEIAEGSMTRDEVEAGFARMRERLGVAMDVRSCTHPAGPPVCWCRKPLPGLGVALVREFQLDPRQCVYVGSGPQDPGFARKLGFEYRDAREVFG